MIHARTDYDRIQDPAVSDPSLLSPGSTPIGEDEPVFLIRARDWLAPDVVGYWADSMRANGGSEEVASHVLHWADRMAEWQQANGRKMPDTPPECLKR